MMYIEDGTGNAYKTKVTSENYLAITGPITNLSYHINSVHKQSYSIVFDQTPTSALNTFLYIKNNSDDQLIVRNISFYCTSAEGINVRLGTSGTPSGSTSYIPISNNTSSGNLAESDCEIGNAISGLSVGNIVDKIFHNGSDSTISISYPAGIILCKNCTLSLDAINGSIQIIGKIDIEFHSELF